MKNFQEKGGWRKIFESWPFLLVFSLLIILFAWGLFDLFTKMMETEKNRDIAEKKVLELEARKEKLNSDIEEINTDKGKERVFRENFGLAKEGEGLVVVVDEKKENTPEEEKQNRFIDFIRNWFK